MLKASRRLGRSRRPPSSRCDSGRRGRASRVGASGSRERPRVAFLSFAVANSYDAPMLKAAKDVAKKSGATMTVFDAANDPKKQFSQLQTLVSSKQYDAIIVQPIFGPQFLSSSRRSGTGSRSSTSTRSSGRIPGTAGLRSPACPATSCSSRRRSAASRARSSGGVQGEQPQPLQRRLPLLREGVLARHGDSERLQLRDQGRAVDQGRRRGRPSISTRSR